MKLALPDGSVAAAIVDLPLINGIHYGTVDLSGQRPLGGTRGTLTVIAPSLGTKIWAMVTLTDNETQEVTAISPR